MMGDRMNTRNVYEVCLNVYLLRNTWYALSSGVHHRFGAGVICCRGFGRQWCGYTARLRAS